MGMKLKDLEWVSVPKTEEEHKMNFKTYYTEGRNPWHLFSIKRGHKNKKWSFRDTQTNSIYYIKIDPNNEIGSMQKFLKDLEATPGTIPKTKGDIDFYDFAVSVIIGDVYKIYVKSGKFQLIKDTWELKDYYE